ncbi:MAG: M56 family metallopeptidase, partial [Planctomycetota bacterium]
MEALYTNLSPFFAWLLRATLQGSLVVCLILLIKLILRNRLPAKWHYCLWLVLLVRLSLPWAPQSRLSIYNVLQPSRWTGPARAPTPVAPRQTSASALADAAGHDDSTSAQPVSPGGPDEGTTSERTAAPEPSAASPVAGRQTRSWLPNAGAGLSMLWLVGAVVLAGYVLARNLRLWRAVRRERPVTDQQVLELLEDAKMQMGVQTILGVVVTDNVKSPALFGFVRPRLLLPQGLLEGLSLDELHYVFLHELAHLKRRDIYIGWWTAILQILHWFNPLLWFALRRMRADQEMACDALALSRLTPEEPAQYGRTVVSLLERFSQPQYVPSVAGILEDPSNIERRMTMIAKFRGSSRRWSPTAAILIIALSCVSLPDAMGKKGRNVSWPESEPSISLRRIKTGPMSDFSSAPSLDGRYLCDVQYRPVRLTIRDLDTGEVRPLTEPTEGYFRCPVISPQSKYVAYVHQSWSPPKSDLQLIRMDGTGRRVLHRLTEDEKFHIRAWAPDGKEVIGAFKKGGKNLQLVAFSIQDGSMQVIHTFDTYWPMWQSPLHKVAISPDGRYIAYDRPPEKGSWNAEIYVLDIEQQRATCVVGHPAYDKLLGWPPDGNHIFFTSDRRQGLPGSFTATNTRDAYLLPVAEGRAQGAPVLIKRDIPDKARPKGFTHDGTYHYAVEFMSIDAVVAKLDMQTGKLATKPQAVGQTGADQIPAWSPDGRYLAYGIHQPDRSQTIRIQDMETGRERELDPNLPHFSWLRWSPDGKSFLVS